MNDLRQRQPRVECPAFLAFVRRKPCCVCGAPPRSQAAHIRIGCPEIGKRSTGLGEKPSDRWSVPLCYLCHLEAPDALHRVGDERAFWARVGIDPFALAMKLYAQFERQRNRTPEQREKIAKRAKRIKFYRPMMEPGLDVEFVIEGGVAHRVHPTKDREIYRRPMQSANRWPPRGSRTVRSRRL